MVSAAHFPGPALWQGVMLCLLPLVVWGLFGWADGGPVDRQSRRARIVICSYIGFGVLLFLVIVTV